MSKDDILNFKVLFYSYDGVNSQIKEYLTELYDKNEDAGNKCIAMIQDLPGYFYSRNKSIKQFTNKKHTFFELKVKEKNNEFRFFFVVEQPNIIVVYGFTKKSQKTDKRDVKNGVDQLEMYIRDKTTIPFKFD